MTPASNSAPRVNDDKINVVADQEFELLNLSALGEVKGLAVKSLLANLETLGLLAAIEPTAVGVFSAANG